MQSTFSKLTLVAVTLLFLHPSYCKAETPADSVPAAAPAAGKPRSVAILPTIDQTSTLGTSLQNALASLFQAADPSLAPSLSAFTLPSFSVVELQKAYQLLNADIISLVYLEKSATEGQANLSIYLFDATHPKEFVVVTRPLTGQGGDALNPQYVEYEFRQAFNDLTNAYSQGVFQPLPGADAEQAVASEEENGRRHNDDAKKLFRELAMQEDRKYYLGANVGLARYSGDSGSDSNVNFGFYGGAKLSERTRMELGLDVFSYALLHLDGRYVLPLNEKIVTLTASLGLGIIMGGALGNSTAGTTTLSGGAVFGPGISFDIPLLGTMLRGDLRFYIGAGSILFGTYGVSYSI